MKKQIILSLLILVLSIAAKAAGWTKSASAQMWFRAILKADYDYQGAFTEARKFFDELRKQGGWQILEQEEKLPGLVRPVMGSVSSGFGMREHPVLGGKRQHQGIDLEAPKGSPILAAMAGEVEAVERDSTYGLKIVLRHANEYRTVYAHCDEALVKAGDQVKAGQVIGRVGDSGLATGPHLHFELRIGDRAIDPGQLIK
ncbi:MAG: M23 family metallopeptidase [Firmicutes bacterium]|jgi:murein DD-endopeptidase MepM/ murein hydrolase activator NlpD|nr:M23 family metallopeptidase [Bacillota bacterium]HQD40763.1 M23 family metallopeptidase [Bacillota bacterium]